LLSLTVGLAVVALAAQLDAVKQWHYERPFTSTTGGVEMACCP